jgi:hypothetical protein
MIKEKGEGFASAYYHSNGKTSAVATTDVSQENKSNGFNLQGGYAFSKKFALAGGISHLTQNSYYSDIYSSPFDTSIVNYKRNEYTVSGIYFLTNKPEKIGLNLLVGATLGSLKINDKGRMSNADYSRYFNSNMTSFFISPCFNIYLDDHSALGFNTRLSYLSYKNNRTNYSSAELSHLRLANTSSIYLQEIGMKFAIGFNKVPLSIDGQFNYILNFSDRVYMKRSNFSTGISYRFRGKKK